MINLFPDPHIYTRKLPPKREFGAQTFMDPRFPEGLDERNFWQIRFPAGFLCLLELIKKTIRTWTVVFSLSMYGPWMDRVKYSLFHLFHCQWRKCSKRGTESDGNKAKKKGILSGNIGTDNHSREKVKL